MLSILGSLQYSNELLPLADIVTPNLKEASALLGGCSLKSVTDMYSAAKSIHSLGPRYVNVDIFNIPLKLCTGSQPSLWVCLSHLLMEAFEGPGYGQGQIFMFFLVIVVVALSCHCSSNFSKLLRQWTHKLYNSAF